MEKHLIRYLALLALMTYSLVTQADSLPPEFVYLDEYIPNLRLEMNYATSQNFIGKPIPGYIKPRAILTQQAAQALAKVQQELAKFGLGLKIHDAYRPQQAVDEFSRWANDPSDNKMKYRYYPSIDKARLFELGYIAARSGHSRGSTVDLTLVTLSDGENLDMGGIFDFFGPESSPDATEPTASQRGHRLLLQLIMTKYGFKPYPQEWWHFTLVNEPFPDTYFNFPVQ